MRTWWLNYEDTSKPLGQGFLGSVFVEAETSTDAVERATATGCDPGGARVHATEIGGVEELTGRQAMLLSETPFNTLLSYAELKLRGLLDR